MREFQNGCPRCGYLKESFKSSRRRLPLGGRKGKLLFPRWAYGTAIVVLSLAIIGMIILILFGNVLP